MPLALMPVAYSWGPRGLVKTCPAGQRAQAVQGKGERAGEGGSRALTCSLCAFLPTQRTQEGFHGVCCCQAPAAPGPSAAGRASSGLVMYVNCLLFQNMFYLKCISSA